MGLVGVGLGVGGWQDVLDVLLDALLSQAGSAYWPLATYPWPFLPSAVVWGGGGVAP